MIVRIEALRSLRWNYRWRGVWAWLWGAPLVRCENCRGSGVESGRPTGWPWPYDVGLSECRRCMGEGRNPGMKIGWERIRDEPEQVLAEQDQLASGAFI